MDGFTKNIDRINALADRADGFVWRMVDETSETDGALDLRLPGDDNMLVNMSVWENIESLYAYVYKTAHAKLIKQRKLWFRPMPTEHIVLWWVEEGHVPDLNEAKSKLDEIRAKGSTPSAFSFAIPFNELGEPIKPQFPKKDCA